MSGGKIFINTAADIVFEAGRNIVLMAGKDIISAGQQFDRQHGLERRLPRYVRRQHAVAGR